MKVRWVLALVISLAAPAEVVHAQKLGAKAKVESYTKNRTGKRSADFRTLSCRKANEYWRMGIKPGVRKAKVHSLSTTLRVGSAGTKQSIDEMLHGRRIIDWVMLGPKKEKDFGSAGEILIVCDSPGRFTIHHEWNRGQGAFDF